MQDAKTRQKIAICTPPDNFSGYIFATKARIDNRKKIIKQQYLLHMFSQYGVPRPTSTEIGPVVWGTPANFNGFRALAALLHGTLVVGASQTLRH